MEVWIESRLLGPWKPVESLDAHGNPWNPFELDFNREVLKFVKLSNDFR